MMTPEEKRRLLQALPDTLRRYAHEGRGTVHVPGTTPYPMLLGSTLDQYNTEFGTDLGGLLRSSKHYGSHPPIVAEVGPGSCRALHELKKRWGAYAVAFEVCDLPVHEGLDMLVVGDFEEVEIPDCLLGRVDLIFSHLVWPYFVDPLYALRKVESMLHPHSSAFIDICCALDTAPSGWQETKPTIFSRYGCLAVSDQASKDSGP